MFSRTLRALTASSASLLRAPISCSSPTLPIPTRSRNLATSATETSTPPNLSSPEPPPLSPTPQTLTTAPSASASPEPTPQANLPYFVGRNNLNNFGVYERVKQGGNLKVTLVKKGEGNLQALKHDIKNALQLADGDVSVNNVTRHIVVRGRKRDEIVHFLRSMGF